MPRRKRRPHVRALADRAPGKRCPNGLAQFALAIQQYWLQEIGELEKNTPPLSHEEFIEKSSFKKTFLETLSLYPDVARPPVQAIAGAYYDMARGNTDMEYYKIRALARFTNLRSAALVLLFSQLVGEERRAKNEDRDPRQACLSLLEGFARIIDASKNHINSKSKTDDIFLRTYDDTPHGHLPDVRLVKVWRDAFLQGILPPDPIVGGRRAKAKTGTKGR
jgi:hypothetical protein